MFEPTSPLIVVLLAGLAVAGLVGLVRLRWLALRIVSGALALVLAMTTGLVLVNDYYGYYRTWTDASNDFAGGAPADARVGRVVGGHPSKLLQGSLLSLPLAGKLSGITRDGLVYLPPQYDQPAYRKTQFPVLELFHGTPGTVNNWTNQLHIAQVMDRLMNTQQIGPMILVMPQISNGTYFTEGLNSNRGAAETYLARDVPADVRQSFRASTDPSQWGLLGYSSGGYIAMNIALRNRDLFGAAASLDGYYVPTDGPAVHILGQDPTLLAANNPLANLRALNPDDGQPIPKLWVMSGTSSDDANQARLFVAAAARIEQTPLLLIKGANHNYYAWQAALPAALTWAWPTISTPALRAHFPLLAPGQLRTIGGVKSPSPPTRTISPRRHPVHPSTAKRSPSPTATAS